MICSRNYTNIKSLFCFKPSSPLVRVTTFVRYKIDLLVAVNCFYFVIVICRLSAVDYSLSVIAS